LYFLLKSYNNNFSLHEIRWRPNTIRVLYWWWKTSFRRKPQSRQVPANWHSGRRSILL